jgi:outer membrane protein assembly factor BamB
MPYSSCRSLLRVVLIAVTVCCADAADGKTPQSSGSDWPKWAGPDGNYTSPEQDLDKSYLPGPYTEWKGVNFSPIVADGVVLIPFASDKTNRCSALDAETGKVKWIYPANTQLPIAEGTVRDDRLTRVP